MYIYTESIKMNNVNSLNLRNRCISALQFLAWTAFEKAITYHCIFSVDVHYVAIILKDFKHISSTAVKNQQINSIQEIRIRLQCSVCNAQPTVI